MVSISNQEQSNPDSSDNAGRSSGGGAVAGSGGAVSQNPSEGDKCSISTVSPSVSASRNGEGTTSAKPYAQKSGGSDTGITNRPEEGDLSKDSSAISKSSSGTSGGAVPRRVMPSLSIRNEAAGTVSTVNRQLEEQQLATDMSDTSDSEQDKNLE